VTSLVKIDPEQRSRNC